MKKAYNVTGAERKELVQTIETFTRVKATYLKAPTYAYQIGDLTVTKDGTLEAEAEISADLLQAIADAGFTATEEEPATEETNEANEAEAEDEAIQLTVAVPLAKHTGNSLRNLLNLIHTRAPLINKALGTSFRVDEELTEALQGDETVLTTGTLLKAIEDYESLNGSGITGLTFEEDKIIFGTLPETTDPDTIRTFTNLCGMMSKQAIGQHRILAKEVNDENEKYALRIWLLRLGMNGPEFKTERKILMKNLSGHCAFRTPAEEERWKKRQAEKRAALKAAKAAAAEETTEEVQA